MKKNLLVLVCSLFVAHLAIGQTLVHYWNFNNSQTVAALLTPTVALVPGAGIVHIAGGTSAIQNTSNTGQGFEITNPNARQGDLSVSHLRFNNPIGGILEFSLPTTGYQQVVVTYGTRRSGSGAGTQIIDYTTDGVNYQNFTTFNPVDGNPTPVVLNFSAIPAVNNNPNFKIQISFIQGPGGVVGNNRFDNFTLDANTFGQDQTPPSVSLLPLNGAVSQPLNTTPTMQFSEDVRLVNNQPITPQDILNIVELRLNNDQGAMVPFTGSFSNNTITITPTGNLLNGQLYYVALLANTVEDLFDNALANLATTTFTTIVPQTAFQPGDLVPVAYRMNAAGSPDEFAMLTFVNILPGTFVNLTDGKYTDNPQPQCAGGLTWTSPNQTVPAGTVIVFSTDNGTVNTGTVAGSTFGLSSGGDQVMVYTGTPAAASHVTALSSNAWTINPLVACGGSISKIPATLADGVSSINLSTAPGNIAANTVNGYYSGPQNGSVAFLRSQILNPANWNGIGGGQPPQVWPNWGFPGPPTVTSAATTSPTSIRVIFNQNMDGVSAVDLAHYTGIANLASATVTNNGTLNDTVTLTFSAPFVSGNTYTLTIADVLNASAVPMLNPFVYTFTYTTTVAFSGRFKTVSETAGVVTITLNVTNPAPNATVNLVFKNNQNSSTAVLADLVNQSQTTSVTLNSTSVVLSIQINNDQLVEQDEYIMFSLENPANSGITGPTFYTLFIRDDDKQAPAASGDLELDFVSRYTVANPNNAIGLTEIVTYDATSQRLFTMSTGLDQFDIVDFSNPLSPTLIQAIDVSAYGNGVTSIAVKNGIVAVSQPGIPTEQDPGHVTFFDTNGVFISQVQVGALPDMVTFTPDGQYVMTADEGQPNDAYTIDPEGSVSFIDISGGVANLTQGDVTILDFTQYNPQTAALIASGVRKLKNTSTLSQDFEPEYLTVDPTSQKAWVTLQENGAIAEIDIATKTFVNLFPLGLKDFSTAGTAGMDISDRGDSIHIANWPIKSFYLPDGTANYQYNGATYLVTANEGDEKEYSGLTERVAIGSVTLDPTVFPNAAFLKENHNMGRHRITNLQGDIDSDGDYDELYTVGSRSFSIWNAQTGAQVYDSGDNFEMITSRDPYTHGIFNADHGDNIFKGRSRSKGPEPEGLTVATIGGNQYAFIGLERVGGIMTYNITNPQAPVFVDYASSRNNQALGGDLGPEGIIYIDPINSPDGKGYVILANEVSGTLAVYEVSQSCNGVANVIYVNDNATGNNTGTSWDNAFTSLQSGLTAAVSGKSIWVAQGTYKPSVNTRNVAFALKAGVSLYGGFPDGGACSIEDRNPEAFVTTLSGDIGVSGDHSDNSYRVITATNVGNNVVVDGFVITRATSNTNGGGVYVSANGVNMVSSPVFSHCSISWNTSSARGGGVYTQASVSGVANPVFENIHFENNTSHSNGGGFSILTQTSASSAPLLTNCIFENNHSDARGGALETWTNTTGSTDITLENCEFNGNTAVSNGGAIYTYARGGSSSNTQATACDFNQNTGVGGGGVFVHNNGALTSATLDSCTFDGNTASGSGGGLTLYAENATSLGTYQLNNTVFNGNQAASGGGIYVGSIKNAVQNIVANELECSDNITSSRGGAIYAYSTTAGAVSVNGANWLLNNNASVTGGAIYAAGVNINANLTNATIAGNAATTAKHLYLGQTATATLTNSILWNGPFVGPTYTGIALKNTSALTLDYVSVDALTCAALVNGTGTATCNNTTYNVDPMFVDAANGDYHLLPNSPAIDGGTLVGAPAFDLDGNARPSGNGIDLGCYEQQNIRPRLANLEENNSQSSILNSQFTTYPNPAQDRLSISFNEVVDAELRLTDLSGRVMGSMFANQSSLVNFDLNALPNGTYILSVITSEGMTSRKIVVFK